MVNKYSDVSKKGLLINSDAVEQSLDNIMKLSSFDVLFNPVGANLESLLFKPMTSQTEAEIYFALISAVEKVDDRIIIDNTKSSVKADYDNNQYSVVIRYRIKGLSESLYTYNRNIKVKFKDIL